MTNELYKAFVAQPESPSTADFFFTARRSQPPNGYDVPVPCKVVNLEEGRPTVNVALLRLDHALASARAERVPLLKLIHGYGSSGVGGRLREEVWKALDRFERNDLITGFIPGEDFRLSNQASWELVKRDKTIKEDRDFGRANRGITVVIL